MKMRKAKNKRRTVAWAAICAAALTAAGSASRCEPRAAFAEDEGAVVEQANEQAAPTTPALEKVKAAVKIETAGRYLNGWYGVEQDGKKGVEILTEAAKSGDPAIKRELAYCYIYGRGVEQDEKKGVEILTEAAKSGDPAIKRELASFYIEGDVVEQDEKKGVELLTEAAEQGDVEANIDLFRRYMEGAGVEKDIKKAIEILWKTAELDDARTEEVKTAAAALYASGCDGERDVEEIFEMCASVGAKTLYAMGAMYLTGYELTDEIAVPVDPATGVRFLKAALAGGCVEARDKLAVCYREGLGVRKNEAKAAAFERNASSDLSLGRSDIQGEAQSAIQYLYDCGEGEKVEAKAAELLREAAELGSKDAIYALAGCYRDGIGVEKDAKKAFELYRQAVEKGGESLVATRDALAVCYATGFGCERNDEKALEIYHISNPTADDVEGLTLLAEAYRGEPILKVQSEARWRRGESGLEFVPGEVKEPFGRVPRNDAIAFRCYEAVATTGDVEACLATAACYREGRGVAKNEALAAEWEKVGAELAELERAKEKASRENPWLATSGRNSIRSSAGAPGPSPVGPAF